MHRFGSNRPSHCYEREADQLRARVRELEAIVSDPEALWANWLRGTIRLPSGIGDVRAANARVRELEARVERLVDAGDKMLSAWLMPEDSMPYSDWVCLSSDAKRGWHAAKEAQP